MDPDDFERRLSDLEDRLTALMTRMVERISALEAELAEIRRRIDAIAADTMERRSDRAALYDQLRRIENDLQQSGPPRDPTG